MAEIVIVTASNMIALWRIVRIVEAFEGIEVKIVMEMARNSGLIAGSLPAGEGLALGRHCKLLEIAHINKLVLTPHCKSLIPLCSTEQPNIHITRAILQQYFFVNKLEWLLFFNEDPEIFKASIPDEWIFLLENSGLFEMEDKDVRSWWSRVFSKFQTYQDGKKLEIEKVAEKLTFDHERNRLQADGLKNDHAYLKWVSQISDKEGYDIASIRGALLKFAFTEKSNILIEVKASVSSSTDAFRFYVSRPEWEKAQSNISSYFFYCWISTNLETQTALGPYIIPADQLKSHFPTDNSEICQWSECRFIIKLNTLKIKN
jgi:hypothetical protein